MGADTIGWGKLSTDCVEVHLSALPTDYVYGVGGSAEDDYGKKDGNLQPRA